MMINELKNICKSIDLQGKVKIGRMKSLNLIEKEDVTCIYY